MSPDRLQDDTDKSARWRGVVRWVSRGLLVVVGIGVVLVAGGAALVNKSPQTCNRCHESGIATAYTASSHASVTCTRCHSALLEAAGLAGAAHIAEGGLRLEAASGSTVGRVPDAACNACHVSTDLLLVTESRGIRMSHRGLVEGGYQCIDCHEGVVHGTPKGKLRVPTMGMCMGCHDGTKAPKSCDTCHVGRTAEDGRRLGDAEFRLTHGPKWRSTHGLGDLTACGTCHLPSKCEKCHGMPLPHSSSFGATHGSQAIQKGIDKCTSCHTQAFCTSCHGMEMPHPQGFLSQHSGIAKSYTDERCMVCHTSANCNECHIRHTHPGRKNRLREPTGMYTK